MDILKIFRGSFQYPLPPSQMSSLRYVGSSVSLNTDTITLYEGTAFTGNEYYTEYDAASLGPLAGSVSSLVITGPSPWTVYT